MKGLNNVWRGALKRGNIQVATVKKARCDSAPPQNRKRRMLFFFAPEEAQISGEVVSEGNLTTWK